MNQEPTQAEAKRVRPLPGYEEDYIITCRNAVLVNSMGPNWYSIQSFQYDQQGRCETIAIFRLKRWKKFAHRVKWLFVRNRFPMEVPYDFTNYIKKYCTP